jgi:hypothetical protein
MMGVSGYKHKKDLKAAVGQKLRYVETSLHGPEFKENGTFCVVGPDAYTARNWFAEVTMQDGVIAKVR